MANANIFGWVEIPVTDMKRAKKFYETVFDVKLEEQKMPNLEMWAFPMVDKAPMAAGALVKHPDFYKPGGDKGIVVYMHSEKLDTELGRVEKAGGKIVMKKKPIGEHGFIGIFMDSEGNRLGMHSMK